MKRYRRHWASGLVLLAVASTLATHIYAWEPAGDQPAAEEKQAKQEELPDITIIVSRETLQRFAQIAMPLRLRGTKSAKIKAPVVGSIGVKVPWTAIVNNPEISIKNGKALFDADVVITSGPLRYKDKVHGHLEAAYDRKNNRIVTIVKGAVIALNVRRGGVRGAIKLDISERLPEVQLPVALPEPMLKIQKKTVHLTYDPSFTFAEDANVKLGS